MKILVLSDSHGNLKGVQHAVKRFGKNADVIVHCGDGTHGEAMWLEENCRDKTVVCVRGNCDFSSKLNNYEFLNICGKRIMVTHGHLNSAKYGLENLSYKAEEEGADVVFFGHTHIPTDETIGQVRLINPGTCSRYSPTCAVVEIDNKGNMLVNIVRV